MSKYYYLRDPDGYIITMFHVDEVESHYVEGCCHQTVSWDSNHNPIECEFFARVYCKWDSCTHWWFDGDDWENRYYHICGPGSLANYIRIMCFIWKLACDLMVEKQQEENDTSSSTYDFYWESEEIVNLVNYMLTGYKIEKGEEE